MDGMERGPIEEQVHAQAECATEQRQNSMDDPLLSNHFDGEQEEAGHLRSISESIVRPGGGHGEGRSDAGGCRGFRWTMHNKREGNSQAYAKIELK